MTVAVEGLGPLEWVDDFAWYRSGPVVVPVLGGRSCRFLLEGYDEDPAPAEFHAAVRTFLAADASVLRAASDIVFAYYLDIVDGVPPQYAPPVVAGPAVVWEHVTIGDQVEVARHGRHGPVTVSVECECSWEPEHGLELRFAGGAAVTWAGQYGH